MRQSKRRMAVRAVGAVALLALANSCGGGSKSVGAQLPTSTTSGRVELPSGTTVLPATLTVTNALGSGAVNAGAQFTVPTFQSGKQLTTVNAADGTPLLMGWYGGAGTTINAHTTAEAALYFALGGWMLPPDAAEQLTTLLATAPETDALAAAITAALATDPAALVNGNVAVQAALSQAVASLLAQVPSPRSVAAPGGPGQTTRSRSGHRSLEVSPSGARSGLTLNTDKGINSIYFRNAYRRRAFCYVDRVSDFDAQNNEKPNAGALTTFDVPPVAGLKSFTSTLVDIIWVHWSGQGDYAYAEVDTDPPVQLPVTDGAAKTRYKVTVVGPGAQVGDLSQLTADQLAKQQSVTQTFVVKDLFLPVVLNLLIGASKDTINGAFGYQAGADGAVKDLINILANQVPGIWDKASKGDVKGALYDGINAFVSSTTFRNAVCQSIWNRMLGGGVKPDVVDAAADRAKRLVNGMKGFDIAFTGIDATWIGNNLANSDDADIWTVDALKSKVVLTPADPTIKISTHVDLTCTVPDASLSGANLQYEWKHTGSAGKLTIDGGATMLDDIVTTKNVVSFFSTDLTGGTDTIEVDVSQIVGSTRPPVGTTTTTVTVTPRQVTVAPSPVSVNAGSTVTLQAAVDPAFSSVSTPIYHWTNTGKNGHLSVAGKSGDDLTITGSDGAAAVYNAAAAGSGTDTVTLAVFIQGITTPIPVGTVTDTVTVKPKPCDTSVIPAAFLSGCSSVSVSPQVVAPGGTVSVGVSWNAPGGLCGSQIHVFCSYAVSATGAFSGSFIKSYSPYVYDWAGVPAPQPVVNPGGAVTMDTNAHGGVTFTIDPAISNKCITYDPRGAGYYQGPAVVVDGGNWSSVQMFVVSTPSQRR